MEDALGRGVFDFEGGACCYRFVVDQKGNCRYRGGHIGVCSFFSEVFLRRIN